MATSAGLVEVIRPTISRVSAQEVDEVETRLVSVSTKVQNAEQNLELLRVRLQQQGMVMSPAAMEDLGLMRASLQRARRQFASGDMAASRDSLEAVDAFATRVLRAAGR